MQLSGESRRVIWSYRSGEELQGDGQEVKERLQ